MLLLVLLSALLHALWNALVKRERQPDLATIGVLGVSALLAFVSALALSRHPLARASLGWAVIAGLFEAAYAFTLGRALLEAPLSLAYPLSRGVAIVVVWPLSVALFHERASVLSVAGAVAVTVGLFLIPGLEARGRAARGVFPAVLCGLAIAGYHLAYKNSLLAGGDPVFVVATSLGLACFLNLAAVPRRVAPLVALVRERPATILLAGAACSGSFLLFLVALAEGGAGAVLTLRNVSVVFALGFALALGESPRPLRVAGSLLVAAGAVAVALGA
jgi:drug/metabolite transporter (DMT)-like permease